MKTNSVLNQRLDGSIARADAVYPAQLDKMSKTSLTCAQCSVPTAQRKNKTRSQLTRISQPPPPAYLLHQPRSSYSYRGGLCSVESNNSTSSICCRLVEQQDNSSCIVKRKLQLLHEKPIGLYFILPVPCPTTP